MHLWMRTHRDLLNEIGNTDGVVNRWSERAADEDYQWMASQMQQRIAGCRGHSLWWAWQKYSGHEDCPLDHGDEPLKGHEVYLRLDIPAHDVLLSDYRLHFSTQLPTYRSTKQQLLGPPFYLPFDQHDEDEFIAAHRSQPGHSYDEVARAAQASWVRCFEPDWPRFDTEWLGFTPGELVQATFAIIRADNIKEIRE